LDKLVPGGGGNTPINLSCIRPDTSEGNLKKELFGVVCYRPLAANPRARAAAANLDSALHIPFLT